MIKKMLLLSLAFSGLIPCMATKIKVDIKPQQNHESQKPIKRAPLSFPIEVVYDTETCLLEVSCESSIEGEVFLYDASGALEDYSPCLNSILSVSNSEYHTVVIEGDGREATGVF